MEITRAPEQQFELRASNYVAIGLGAVVVGGVLVVGARRRAAVSARSLDA